MNIEESNYDEEIAYDCSSDYSENSNESINERNFQENQKQKQKSIQHESKNDNGINIERIDQYAIYNIVVSKLFPRIRFLDKNKDLDFSREKVVFVIIFSKYVT